MKTKSTVGRVAKRKPKPIRKISNLARTWKVHVSIDSRKLGMTSKQLRELVVKILSHVDSEVHIASVDEVHVAIIGDAAMRELNREHRSKDKPTDVLSFPQFEPGQIRGNRRVPAGAGSYLGDLIISSDTTLRQAKEFGVSVRAEVIRLVVHGLLHLCGYDHEGVPSTEGARMRRRERRIRALLEKSGR